MQEIPDTLFFLTKDTTMGKYKDKLYAELKKDKTVAIGLDSKIPYFVNSGHYGLNRVLSGMWYGGWAAGTVNELFGDPSAGKSLVIARAMAAIQKGEIWIPKDSTIKLEDTFNILDDTEKVYSEVFCRVVGMDTDDLIKLKKVKTVEDHFTQLEEKVKKIRAITRNSPIGAFLDSISQLSTKHEQKEGFNKADMTKAKMVHQAMRLYSDFIYDNRFLYLIASHVIDNIGQTFGPKRVVKGGGGLAFQSSVRIDLKYKTKFMTKKIKTDEGGERGDSYGVRIIPTAAKNKVVAPFKWTVMDVYFDKGIDPYSGLFDYFTRQGNITVKEKAKGGKKPVPAVYYFDNGKIAGEFYRDNFDQFIVNGDVLDLKERGVEYMPLLDKSSYINLKEEEITDTMTPAPPPEQLHKEGDLPVRSPKLNG